MKKLLLFLTIILPAVSGYADSSDVPYGISGSGSATNVMTKEEAAKILVLADTAYSHGDTETARAYFDSVCNNAGVSAPLLFNLANACYKSGDTGHAVLALLRARRLNPGDKAINDNLNFLRTFVADANRGELKGKKGNLEPDEPTFFGRLYDVVASDVRSDTWATWSAVCFVLFIVAAGLYFLTNNVALRKGGFFGGFILLGLSVVFICFAFAGARQVSKGVDCVLLDSKTTLLKSAPSQDGSMEGETVSVPLHSGTELSVIPDSAIVVDGSHWIKVRLNSDVEGWISEEAVEVI